MSTRVKVKVRPRRLRRRERRAAKLLALANEQLILCQQVAAFHKAYLEILYGVEEAKFEAINARLAALGVTPAVAVTTEETVEVVEEAPEAPEVEEVEEVEAVIE